jgi:hypothetical protein
MIYAHSSLPEMDVLHCFSGKHVPQGMGEQVIGEDLGEAEVLISLSFYVPNMKLENLPNLLAEF